MKIKPLVWDKLKNQILQETRGVTFEQVATEIAEGRIEEVYINNRGRVCYVVILNDYPHVVPTVESENEIVLKTIWPDRRLKK